MQLYKTENEQNYNSSWWNIHEFDIINFYGRTKEFDIVRKMYIKEFYLLVHWYILYECI